jgi:excisionase family DNA binding protein
MTDQQLLTVEQIAQEFQLTSQTIRNWIHSGALSAVKIGHVYRVRREDVDEMMRRHEGETAPLGTHRDLWAPETLGMPYRPRRWPAAVDLGQHEQLDRAGEAKLTRAGPAFELAARRGGVATA